MTTATLDAIGEVLGLELREIRKGRPLPAAKVSKRDDVAGE